MIAIRKAWWATLVLTVFIGCGAEEGPAGDNPPPPPPSPSSSDPAAPSATPPAGDAAKEGMGAEITPPPTQEAAPKDAPPDSKPEGELKLDAPAVTPPAKEEEPKKDEAAAGAAASLLPDEIAELASLTAADKEIALKQVVCPVSGENLGSMGAPLKVSAEGKTFMICCKGCSEDVKDNPKEVVAKLKK